MDNPDLPELPRLYTVPEVVELLGSNIGPSTIRRLAREKRLWFTEGPRGKVLLTQEQISAFVKSMERKPVPPPCRIEESPFGASERSRRLRRRWD